MKKIFGGIDLKWPWLILMAVLAGAFTAAMCLLPAAHDTSFSDIAVTFEVWILFGIFIIMNSKTPLESACKCFVFFLISQPLVYLIQDFVNHSQLFMTYYRNWTLWTLLTFPMGFIGHYMKKNKWWGLVILAPILVLLAEHYRGYLSRTMFSFPRHLLTTLFCLGTMFLYPLVIFASKRIRLVGTLISAVLALAMTILVLTNPPVYRTILLANGTEHPFDNSYRAYFTDKSFGDLRIEYNDSLEDWVLHVDFKKAGKAELVLESPNGKKNVYDVTIQWNTCEAVPREGA